MNSIKWRNISISGQLAVGTTTLLNLLKPHLEPLGWSFYSGGQFVRDYVEKKGLELENAEARGDTFTRELDGEITRRLKEESNLVIESWLAGFDAQNIDGVFKILLICPNQDIIVDRVVNRDHRTVDEAKNHIKDRTEANIAKWHRIYGNHNFWDPNLYDLVINTYSNGPTETVDLTLQAIGYFNGNHKSA